jgi:hypothetical protein
MIEKADGGFGAPRCCLARGLQLLVLPSSETDGP